MKVKPSVSRKLLFAAAVSVCLLVGLEIAARKLDLVTQQAVFAEYNWAVAAIVDFDAARSPVIPDPGLIWRPRPGYSWGHVWESPYGLPAVSEVTPLNEYGLRGGGVGAKRPGARRVLTLGDSCTFGVGARSDETYAARLPALLEERTHAPWDCVNGGVPGYSSLQGARWLTRVAPLLRPDVVTVYFGWNDHWKGVVPDSRNTLMAGTLASETRLLLYRLALYKAIRRAIFRYMDRLRDTPRVPLDEYEQHLGEIVWWGRKLGFTVVLLTAPAGPDPASRSHQPDPQHEAYVEATRRAAAATGAPLLDLREIFARSAPDGPLLFHDPVHPNGVGHEVIAEALADLIARTVGEAGGTSPAARSADTARAAPGHARAAGPPAQ